MVGVCPFLKASTTDLLPFHLLPTIPPKSRIVFIKEKERESVYGWGILHPHLAPLLLISISWRRQFCLATSVFANRADRSAFEAMHQRYLEKQNLEKNTRKELECMLILVVVVLRNVQYLFGVAHDYILSIAVFSNCLTEEYNFWPTHCTGFPSEQSTNGLWCQPTYLTAGARLPFEFFLFPLPTNASQTISLFRIHPSYALFIHFLDECIRTHDGSFFFWFPSGVGWISMTNCSISRTFKDQQKKELKKKRRNGIGIS